MLSVDALNLYYGASHTLRDVSITVETGKITCLLGRNGVGKTSLLQGDLRPQPDRQRLGHVARPQHLRAQAL